MPAPKGGITLHFAAGPPLTLRGEIAQAWEILMSSLEKTKGNVVDLGAAFTQAQARVKDETPAEPAEPKLLRCPLANLHAEMTIPCPSCGVPPKTVTDV